MFAGVHAMVDSLQWLAVNWKLCIASLALLPPIFIEAVAEARGERRGGRRIRVANFLVEAS